MSVDTYLKGKNTSRYRVMSVTDDGGAVLRVLVAPSVAGWSRLEIFPKWGLAGRRLRAGLWKHC